MTTVGELIFQETLTELERGLTTSLIASRDVLWLDADCPVDTAEWQMEQRDFSQIPVKNGGRVVGVYVQHSGADGGVIRDWMRPFDDSTLVSMNAPLLEIIHSLAAQPPDYRLVVGSRGIEGIVTPSDLQKLPVRLLAFSLVTHLESVMANLIQRVCPEEDVWLQYLDEANDQTRPRPQEQSGRSMRRVLRGNQQGLKKGGMVPDLLELTDFRHKYLILARAMKLGSEFEDDLRKVNKWLRNAVAHSRGVPPSTDHLRRFSNDIVATQKWTAVLGSYLAGSNLDEAESERRMA